MAAQAATTATVPLDTPITIKISVNDNLKKLKLPLRDLGANVLPDKLRQLLGIKPEQTVVFERFSDSAGGFIFLDPTNPQVFKTLARAAKAKLKLRLKATVSPLPADLQENIIKPEPAADKTSIKMVPVIVQSPVYQDAKRDSTAVDGRSLGDGIFQFREARASQQTLVDTSEAPLPEPFPANSSSIFKDLATVAQGDAQELAIRSREPPATLGAGSWSVYCNACDASMIDSHYHCDICDGGDYDLCQSCVDQGRICEGEGHWLIKRFIKDGQVVNSFTERLSPREKVDAKIDALKEKKAVAGVVQDQLTKALSAVSEQSKEPVTAEATTPTRTCNSCIVVRAEHDFVTCSSCDDFDLCQDCHISNKHGHHPGHEFEAATEKTVLPLAADLLLAAGRNVRHDAICDGCDQLIHGVRHKCLNCPDWDFCSKCIKDAGHTHPRHRFAPLYEPIANPAAVATHHTGIYCDGPLCRGDQSYITGVRYKCAVCNDTDFCSACEALPTNTHNRTHPLIMFKTPVRGVTVATDNEDVTGVVRKFGDRNARTVSETKNVFAEPSPVPKSNAATQVQTMAEIKPTRVPCDTRSRPFVVPEPSKPTSANKAASGPSASFVKDMIPDGMVVRPGARMTQIWVMRNDGPNAWPSGCSVRYTGGDNMLNIDNEHPASTSDINKAKESNVVGRDVNVGEEIGFKVVLKAPTREGRHISYWRLMAADGQPFGHRLWCDIVVKGEQVPNSTSELPAPPMLPAACSTFPSWYSVPTSMPNPSSSTHKPAFSGYVSSDLARHSVLSQQRQLAHQRQVMMEHQQQMLARHAYTSPYGYPSCRANLGSRPPPSYVPLRPDESVTRVPLTDEDRARREAAKLRVEQVKARILKARGMAAEPVKALDKTVSEIAECTGVPVASPPTVDASVPTPAQQIAEYAPETDTVQVAPEVQEAVAEETAEEASSSQMVFPKLDKESPASSTYQSLSGSSIKGKAAYVENEDGEVERSASPAAAPASIPDLASPGYEDGFDDLTDDLEVLSADQRSEDDGFLTDEEYDVLDASDRETVASK